MATIIRGELEGVEAVLANLDGLKKSLRGRITRKAVTKASRQLAKSAKSNTPKGPTGLLRKSIGSKVKTYKSGAVVGIIGARKGFKRVIDGRPVDPAKYAHLPEKGRKAVAAIKAKVLAMRAKGGTIFARRAAAAPGQGWLRRAWTAGKKAAEATVTASIKADLAHLPVKR